MLSKVNAAFFARMGRPEISNTICNYLGGLMQDCRWLTLTLGEVLAFLR